jgi:predicted GIY-YIG superfamily endonuclease
MQESLFVLECSYDKWYIGKAKDVLHQVTYLECGFGPDWTRTYSPIRIVEQKLITSPDDMMTVTKQYMKKYGIDNVRCETMCSLVSGEGNAHVEPARFLDPDFERALRFELYATDRSSSTNWNCQYCVSDYPTRDACRHHEETCQYKPAPPPSNSCTRCGRHEHSTDRCYERRHVGGWTIR